METGAARPKINPYEPWPYTSSGQSIVIVKAFFSSKRLLVKFILFHYVNFSRVLKRMTKK